MLILLIYDLAGSDGRTEFFNSFSDLLLVHGHIIEHG